MTHQLSSITDDCLIHAFNFLPTVFDRSALKLVSKHFNDIVNISELEELKAFPKKSFIGRMVHKPIQETERQLVNRVKNTAIAQIQTIRKKFRTEDWAALKADPKIQTSALNFEQLNLAYKLEVKKNRLLVAEFEQLLTLSGSLRQKVDQIRISLNEANPEIIEDIFTLAIENQLGEVVKALLESDQEIDPKFLGEMILGAVNTENMKSLKDILATDRKIDPFYLETSLGEAVQLGKLDFVQQLLQCKHPFTVMTAKIIARESPEMLKAINASGRPTF